MSNKRDYIDCIDVDDLMGDKISHRASSSNLSPVRRSGEGPTPSSPERASGGNLTCTLVLFNDKLLIVKRQSGSVSGLEVTGLSDVDNLLAGGGGLTGLAGSIQLRRDKLSFKGVVDILDVIAADVGDSSA
jgi:hypothetical protein